MNTQNVNYNNYTILPTKVFAKADGANPVIEVKTPHRGIVFIEIKEVEKGLFRKATEIDKKTQHVLGELWKLEGEAQEFLLKQWVTNLIH